LLRRCCSCERGGGGGIGGRHNVCLWQNVWNCPCACASVRAASRLCAQQQTGDAPLLLRGAGPCPTPQPHLSASSERMIRVLLRML
jgi:hypothetical protein